MFGQTAEGDLDFGQVRFVFNIFLYYKQKKSKISNQIFRPFIFWLVFTNYCKSVLIFDIFEVKFEIAELLLMLD